jgi:hypothetical protein
VGLFGLGWELMMQLLWTLATVFWEIGKAVYNNHNTLKNDTWNGESQEEK